jgi:transposase
LELTDFKQEEGATTMTSTAVQYVGIDVHQATLVCAVKDVSGITLMESKVTARRDSIEAFIRGLGSRVHVAFEEGSQAQWLYDILRPISERVVVCDARRIATKGNKDDRRDASKICDLLRLNALHGVYHGHADRTLGELVRLYEALLDDSLRVMLRIRASYRSRGIPVKSQSVYHPSRRSEWLEQITDVGGRFRVEQLYAQLDVLLKLRRRARTAVLREAAHRTAYQQLRSVPGIGPLRAAEIIATVDYPQRFRTKRQLWSYAGLGLVTRTSGEWDIDSTGRIRRSSKKPMTRGLTQNFNRLLKKVFKMAAHDVSRRPGEMQRWYEQLIDHGVRPEMARLSLARKIAAVVLAVWKKGVTYDPRLITQQV